MASGKTNNTTMQSHISNSLINANLNDESSYSAKSKEDYIASDFNPQLNVANKNWGVNLPAAPSSGIMHEKNGDLNHPLMKNTIGSSPSPPPMNSGSKIITSKQTSSTQQGVKKLTSSPPKQFQPTLQPSIHIGAPTSP